jgi:hypothetical protein
MTSSLHQPDLHDPVAARRVIEYMQDVCEALSEYVLAGGTVEIESTRDGAALTSVHAGRRRSLSLAAASADE